MFAAELETTVEYKTQTRQMIMDFMADNPDRIFKASEIAKSLSEVSLSTIYRNLSRLEKAGMIQIVGAAETGPAAVRAARPMCRMLWPPEGKCCGAAWTPCLNGCIKEKGF